MNKDEAEELAIEGLKMITKLAAGASNPILAGIIGIADAVLRAADGKVKPEDAYAEMKALEKGIAQNDAEADKALSERFPQN